MLSVKCDFCSRHLNQPGGLLFSPPDENGMVRKKHLCTSCYGFYDMASVEHRRKEPRSDGE